MQFLELSEQEYAQFACQHPYRNFLNSSTAISLKSKNGWNYAFVGVKEGNKILGATPLVFVPCMKNNTYAYAQRGFLIDYENLELLRFLHENLLIYLKQKKAVYLKLDPYIQYIERDIDGNAVENGFHNQSLIDSLQHLGYIHQGFSVGFDNDSQARWMFVLNLEGKTNDSLLKEMDHQTRWSVNKTIKMGIKVREVSIEELPEFVKILDYAANTRNFQGLSLEQYQNQREAYGEECAKMLIAYLDVKDYLARIDDDRIREQNTMNEIDTVLAETPNSKKFVKKKRVQQEALDIIEKRNREVVELKNKYGDMIPMAASYFLLYADEVVYISSGAYDEFRNYNAPYAIQWYMLNYALQHNYKRYNFYGTSGDFTKEAIDYGVYEFKKGFSGTVEEYVGDFVLPIQPTKYALLQKLKNIKQKIRK